MGKKGVMSLDNWKLVYPSGVDAMMSPEAMRHAENLCLMGEVDRHHTLICTKSKVRSASIATVDGRLVQTYSGSVYFLGRPDPEFAERARHLYQDWDKNLPLLSAARRKCPKTGGPNVSVPHQPACIFFQNIRIKHLLPLLCSSFSSFLFASFP